MRQFKGATQKGGHKTPKWDWETSIYFGDDTPSISETLKLTVMEEDLTSSNLVAESHVLKISDLVEV